MSKSNIVELAGEQNAIIAKSHKAAMNTINSMIKHINANKNSKISFVGAVIGSDIETSVYSFCDTHTDRIKMVGAVEVLKTKVIEWYQNPNEEVIELTTPHEDSTPETGGDNETDSRE